MTGLEYHLPRTQAEWLASANPYAMLHFLALPQKHRKKRVSDRKLSLSAVAFVRRVFHLLPDERPQEALRVAEQYADGAASDVDLKRLGRDLWEAFWEGLEEPTRTWAGVGPFQGLGTLAEREYGKPQPGRLATVAAALAAACAAGTSRTCASGTLEWVAEAMTWELLQKQSQAALDDELHASVWRELAHLVRHIVPNPFRPHQRRACWPSAVTQLAAALYHGHDCGFALHDALLEAGDAELAEHFRKEVWHPKGCWVIDLILRRK